ncbi:hypothetical protein [Janthinobacterium sp.]|uniref:hypothetical protein n=1 Tax=Janthinobacterium sp. TaxID=1871054 RepID=UPI002DB877D1|nr:hypothetical protein [Janthinobacterium sp.]HEU4816205.1 hypothetical protein [Janthinobacterium sp.]
MMKMPFFAGRARAGAAPAPLTRRKANNTRLSLLLLFPLLFLALLVGAVAGLDSPVLLLIVSGAIFAMLAFFLVNANILLHLLFVVTFVIQGSALYFFGLRSATWIAVGMAGLFGMRTFMDLVVKSRQQRRGGAPEGRPVTLIMLPFFAYLLCYMVSIVLNRPSAGQLMSALKSNLPVFGVLLSFYWFAWRPATLERLWQSLIWIGVLQLPVVLYQHFFVSTKRDNGFDSVVGTFGGTPLGGGLSSMLVLFVVAVSVYALARWNRGLMSRPLALLVFAIGLAVILLGEVKAAFIWLPLGVFIVLRQRIMKNLFSVIAYGILAVAMLGSIYFVYNALYWGQTLNHSKGLEGKLDAGGGYFFDTHNVNYLTGEISRGASLALWAKDATASIPKRLLGYGPGASKSSSSIGGSGVIARRFAPLNVDATALAVLLWDVGVLGAAAYSLMAVGGVILGWRYMRRGQGSAAQMAIVEASVAVLLIYVSLLIYNRTMLDEPTVQLLYLFCLGSVVQVCRYGQVAATAGPAEAPVPVRPRWRAATPAGAMRWSTHGE